MLRKFSQFSEIDIKNMSRVSEKMFGSILKYIYAVFKKMFTQLLIFFTGIQKYAHKKIVMCSKTNSVIFLKHVYIM